MQPIKWIEIQGCSIMYFSLVCILRYQCGVWIRLECVKWWKKGMLTGGSNVAEACSHLVYKVYWPVWYNCSLLTSTKFLATVFLLMEYILFVTCLEKSNSCSEAEETWTRQEGQVGWKYCYRQWTHEQEEVQMFVAVWRLWFWNLEI